MPDPVVTWLMPVRNAMPYLPEALASLAAQTYRHHRVLAWDNGSTDGSVEELHRWIPHRLPGRVVDDQPLSLGRCRARMVEEADTELLAVMDGDDISRPERLQVQVAYMQAHPQIALVGGAIQKITAQAAPLPPAAPPPLTHADVRWMMRFSCPVMQPAVLYKRTAVLGVGNYHDICPGQDFNLWARMSRTCRMGNVPDVVLCYRIHERAVSRQDPAGRAALDRQGLERVADILFPGMEPREYHRLYHLVRDYGDLSVRRADLGRMRRLAVDAARLCGEPDDYFLRSAAFGRQWNNLLTRWLKTQPGLAQAWPLLRWTAHLPGRLSATRRAA